MKKGKKWMALTGALAVGVMTLIGGSDAKVVQAEVSDEEVDKIRTGTISKLSLFSRYDCKLSKENKSTK